MKQKSNKTRALALTTALAAVASAGAIVSSAHADTLPGQTVSVASGNAGTTFALNLTAPNNECQGDTATDGYKWGMYVADTTVDLDALAVSGSGAITSASGFVQRMFSTTGSPQSNKNTAVTTGQITGTSTVNFLTNTIPGNGQYVMGYLCYTGGTESRHWSTTITVKDYVSPTDFNWVVGKPASIPPFAVTAAGGNTEITGTLTPDAAAVPAVTEYKVIATPQGGGAPVEVIVPVGGPYGYTIPGLTNGTPYDVTATATNAAGVTTFTYAGNPVTPALEKVTPAPDVDAPSATTVTVSWTPSTETAGKIPGATLVSHTVTFVPVGGAAAIAPETVNAPATSATPVTGTIGDSYVVEVVGNYDNGQVTLTGSDTFTFISAQVVVQDITVVRPAGALVLTQRCGVYGTAAAYTDALFGPQFPQLDGTTGADATGVAPNALPPAAVGTAPVGDDAAGNPTSFGTNPVGPVGQQTAPGVGDVLFNQYPYPVDGNGDSIATYATNCGITLEQARLITSGPSAGQYFRSTGRIAQLTVVDTRNIDAGWTLNGQMSDFFLGGNTTATEKFSGNLLGWVPKVTWDSNPNLDGYDMTVAAGNTRLPVASTSTAGLGAQDPTNGSLVKDDTTRANSLAQALPLNTTANTGGLGMAVMDARINLLIPVSADAGTYEGVLTFTIV